jgi:hypothetical protein
MCFPYELGTVKVNPDVDNTAPETRDVELRFISAPDVPTEPSAITVVPSDFVQRKNVAVPVAAIVTLEIAAAVITPLLEVNAADAGNAIVANNVFPLSAVSGVVGCVPEYI